MRRGNPLDRLIAQLLRSRSPASYVLLALAIVFWLVLWLLSGGPGAMALAEQLLFDSETAVARPWTFFTYTLVHIGVGTILFAALGLYFFATSLERTWGTKRFLAGFLVITCLTSVSTLIGAMVLGRPYQLGSMAMPVACVIVAWATHNPNATVLLWFVLPLKAAWIGWITFVLTLVGFSYTYPAMAGFLLAPFVLTWAYSSGRLVRRSPKPKQRMGREEDYSGLDWKKRRQAEEERRRLKELFERSWREDDEEKGV